MSPVQSPTRISFYTTSARCPTCLAYIDPTVDLTPCAGSQNTSLQWAFYTGQHFPIVDGEDELGAEAGTGGWEGFKAAIVQLAW